MCVALSHANAELSTLTGDSKPQRPYVRHAVGPSIAEAAAQLQISVLRLAELQASDRRMQRHAPLQQEEEPSQPASEGQDAAPSASAAAGAMAAIREQPQSEERAAAAADTMLAADAAEADASGSHHALEGAQPAGASRALDITDGASGAGTAAAGGGINVQADAAAPPASTAEEPRLVAAAQHGANFAVSLVGAFSALFGLTLCVRAPCCRSDQQHEPVVFGF